MPFLLKTLLVSLLIAAGETANGILRIRVLYRVMPVRRAKVVSLLSGCGIIFVLTWLLLPWLAPSGNAQLLLAGGVWLVVLLAYDLFVGRVVFRQPWAKIAEDFDLARGHLLPLGMVFLFLCPLLVDWLQR